MSLPLTSDTKALAPPPEVPSLSKFKLSFTLKSLPDSIIWNPSTPPFVTDSTTELCSIISFDSTIKSLSANLSLTLYGSVFLITPCAFKSKLVWSIKKLSDTGSDL